MGALKMSSNGQTVTGPDPRVHSTSPIDEFRVALICMPWASAERPSIQVGLMAAIAEQAGFATDVYAFNLDLAAQLSPLLYEPFCGHRGHLTGEWLFGPAAFDSVTPNDEDDYFRAFPEELDWAGEIGKDQAYLVDLRRRVLPQFIENCLASVDWSCYQVVGFSSTFQQNVACLALARRIKECHPNLVIVFGGANMEGDMGQEYARAFPFIDYVVSGEGDTVFPALLNGLAAEGPSVRLPNVLARGPQGEIVGSQASPITNLDASPVPNYDAYFERATHLGLLPHYKDVWMLPFESSRGCWWGQKHHCTFCGLNGLGMSYRSKTSERVMAELSELSHKHRISAFEAVDNILDLKYLEGLFGQIRQAKLDYQFFYEVKANLSRAQIKTLYEGGVRRIQPGIESMSTNILRLMRKGCSMLQNVVCLKWSLYYDIRVSWNLIWGFPGETRVDYEKELEVLQSISHLEPPKGSGRIWLERFSPNYTDRGTFPVRNVRPEASYSHVYPAHVNLDKAAYFFDYSMGDTVPPEAHLPMETYVNEWQQSWESDQRHTLTYRRTNDGLLIDYNWGPTKQGTYSLFGPLALIYESCVETAHTVDHVVRYLRSSPEGHEFSVEEVQDAMDEFCSAHLMLSEDGKYLSLALPSNRTW